MTPVLIALAVLIVLVLAAYAGWLHYRLWLRAKQGKAAVSVGSRPPKEPDLHRVELKKSIFLLADAMLDDKMTITEGCLRICAMASHLEDRDSFALEYGVLFRVADSTAHIPILDEWKALSKEEKRRYDRERQGIEQKYNAAVVEAVERIRKEFL